MAYLRQTHFSAGELEPQLWGRNDSPKFASGYRSGKNFFVSKTGGLVSRPGTVYIGAAENNTSVRLVPFVYSDSVSYVLEFGHQIIRYYQNGSLVTKTIGGVTTAVTTTTPWTTSQNWFLNFAQSGNTLIITSQGGYPPKELKRTSISPYAVFTLSDMSFSPYDAFFVHPTSQTTITSPPYVYPDLLDVDYLEGDADHPPQAWKYKVSTIFQNPSTGVMEETKAYDVIYYIDDGWTFPELGIKEISVYRDHKITLEGHTGVPPPPAAGGFPARPTDHPTARAVQYCVYRGKGDVFGFIGAVPAVAGAIDGTTSFRFTDDGTAPDYALPPLMGTNPFLIKNSSAVESYHYPYAVCFFADRLCFGGTSLRWMTLFMSATGNYKNFDTPYVQSKTQSIEYGLVSRKLESIRGMIAASELIVLTDSSVWSVALREDMGLGADSVDARVIEEVGCSFVRPLSINGAIVYVRAKGRGVRGLLWSKDSYGIGSFSGGDLSSMAGHLFDGADKEIVDWTFQEDPWGVVWAAQRDGKFLSLTFSRENDVLAWCNHETDGTVVSVCAVPESTEDYVYMAVKRGGTIYIERMASRAEYGTSYDNIALDAAHMYYGTPSTTVTGLSRLNGKTVYATSYNGVVYGPFTVSGGSITLPEAPAATDGSNVRLYVGLKFDAELESLDAISQDTRMKQKAVTAVAVEVTETRGIEAGTDENNLLPWRQRAVSDAYGAIGKETSLVYIPISSTWNYNGRVFLRQTLPLPISIVSITREIDIGG